VFSARQGVEDDEMNVFCLGGKVIGSALAWELVETFLVATSATQPATVVALNKCRRSNARTRREGTRWNCRTIRLTGMLVGASVRVRGVFSPVPGSASLSVLLTTPGSVYVPLLLVWNACLLVDFLVILWMLFFSFIMPVRRSNWTSYRDLQTPLQLLQRRYAAGEITSEEYEERRLNFCGMPRRYKSGQCHPCRFDTL